MMKKIVFLPLRALSNMGLKIVHRFEGKNSRACVQGTFPLGSDNSWKSFTGKVSLLDIDTGAADALPNEKVLCVQEVVTHFI